MNQFVKIKEGFYKYSGKCRLTGKPYETAIVKGEDLFKYNNGAHVQNAFPYLSADDREFIISGFCPEAFDTMVDEYRESI